MSKEQQWLVRSSDAILGPYKFDQVVESIFSGDIHLLDEIQGPYERWRPIKDHSLFAAAIEKLKASTYNKRENTMTATIDLGTQTHDLTASQTVSTTDKLDSSTERGVTPKPVGRPTSPVTPSYQNLRERKTASFSNIFLVSFCVIVLLGAAYMVYEKQKMKIIEQKVTEFDRLTDQALFSLKIGEYQRALDNFVEAYKISPNDPNLIMEMAPLSVQFGGQFSQSQILVENLLASKYQKNYRKQGKNIIGMTYSYRSKFEEALVAYNESLGVDDQYLPALINKAYALIQLQKYERAVDLMRQVVSDFPQQAVAHYMYVRSLVELGAAKKSPTHLREALSVADQYTQKFFDFSQEVLFLVAYSQLKTQKSTEQLTDAVKSFLKFDAELTNLHVHNIMIDFQIFNWIDFSVFCSEIQTGLSESLSLLLQGFCDLKLNKSIAAKSLFEKQLKQQSSNGILHGLYAATLLKLNELSEAKNTLGFIEQVEFKPPLVEMILRGCLSANDFACARTILKGKNGKHISLLYSHWGNAVQFMKNDRKHAKRAIKAGLGLSANFGPLLKLQEKLK